MVSENQKVLNIAAYKFVALDDLAELRKTLRETGQKLGLKGSILLSPEGINMFLAGAPQAMNEMLTGLKSDSRFSDLEVKESWTEHQPFRRFLVKLKKEIIAFGVEGIHPEEYTSPRVSAKELKAWIQQGRQIRLLDVRNDYEIEVGTFANAKAIGVDHFRDFPEAVEQLPEEWKQQPVVTFCTGGIRCEKAAPYMEKMGFQEVYQLEGGILKYFEEIGSEFYDGECFVFDQRVSVDPALAPTDKLLCFACQAVLTPADQEDDRYVPEVSCPHCFRAEDERKADQLLDRQQQWDQSTLKLPGAEPYDHERPLRVSERLGGLSVAGFLEAVKTHLSREDWSQIVAQGQLRRRGERLHEEDIVNTGDILIHHQPAHVEPHVGTALTFLYEDEDWVVIDKPAPLPAHPSGRFCRHTLTYLLDQIYYPQRIRLVHRLDAATTGVMVLARHRKAAAQLQRIVESAGFEKTYLVQVQGHPPKDEFVCNLAISNEPVDGLRRIDPDGLPAETRFKVIKRIEDGTALLEASPVTGRTNQIRLHAWALGFPVVGDPMYLPAGKTKSDAELATTEATLGLHAWRLCFQHPITGKRVEFEAPRPSWAQC